mgnify:CR=1 FL=1
MSTVPPAVPRASSPAAFTGPLVWRKVVDWLSADGVISADEAQRTIARCSQAESAQNPLVRLSNVAMARASDGRPLDIEALTEYVAQRAGLPYLRDHGEAIAPLGDALTRAFNQRLAAALAGVPQVHVADVYGLTSDMLARPGHYGLSNVTDVACGPNAFSASPSTDGSSGGRPVKVER